MTLRVPDHELPCSKPEIWWVMKDFRPGDNSPRWACVVSQSWSKAQAAFPGQVVARASLWRESLKKEDE